MLRVVLVVGVALLACVAFEPGRLTFGLGVELGVEATIGGAAVLVAALRVVHLPRDRAVWALFTLVLALDVVGDVGAQLARSSGQDLSAPLIVVGAAGYPLLYVVVLLSARARLGHLGWGTFADGLLAGVGVAGLAVALLGGRLLDTGSRDGVAPVQVLGGTALLVVIIVSWGVAGWRPDRATTWIALGAATHLAAGAVLLAGPPGEARAPLVAVLLALGHVCFGFAPWQPDHPVAPGARPGAALVLPAVTFASTGALLLLGTTERLPPLAAGLGALGLFGAAGRLVLLHRDLGDLTASRVEAHTDELTRLGNRRLLRERLDRALARRADEEQVVLLLADLDRFKDVNDEHGHHVGDDLLRTVAGRLRQAVGSTCALARLGGDEFAVLVGPVLDGRGAAQRLAEDLLERLRRPFRLHGAQVTIDASIGLAVCPDDALDGAELLRRADAAMYRAKSSRTGTATFVAELDEAAGRSALVGDLRRALDERELEVHYQPIVELGSRRVDRLEALVRWRHPTRGLLAPGDFLGLADRAGLAADLLRFVLDDALGHARRWRAEGLAERVAVNLSAAELAAPRLARLVDDQLRAHGLPPEVLELEVSEDSLGIDLDHAATVLGQLHLLGVRLAIDDYGSGPGSFSILRRLPAASVKLDRAFVTALAVDPENQAVVAATGDLARAFGLELVAEGVEVPGALPLLHELGCHAAQGVAICPPLAPTQVTQWLRRQVARRTAATLHP